MYNKIPSQLVRYFLGFSFIIILATSCIPNRKLIYVPNKAFNYKEITMTENKPEVYKLQPRDVVSIKVKTLDLESSSYFNLQPENSLFNFNQGLAYLNGHSIDEQGYIKLSEVGLIKIGGLSIAEAQKVVEEKLSRFLNKSSIIIKLLSFKVTILGEVHRPGHYYVYNDQATIFETLGMAGDLTDFGNRKNITLVRQSDAGVGAVLINLKDPNLLSSDFYYLQPNDVIYVQPLKAKTTRGNLNSLSFLSIFFGVVSTTILIFNFVNK